MEINMPDLSQLLPYVAINTYFKEASVFSFLIDAK
jgi:hypothetical protein